MSQFYISQTQNFISSVTYSVDSIQDFSFKLGIQTRVQLQALIDSSHSIVFLYTDFALSLQILGIFLENKVFQKIIKMKCLSDESWSPILIFLGENQFWMDQTDF